MTKKRHTQPSTPEKPSRISSAVRRINIFHPICTVLFGSRHSALHRVSLGVLVAAVGVVVAKCSSESSHGIVHYLGDGVGYGIHAIGLTPLIEALAKAFEDAV